MNVLRGNRQSGRPAGRRAGVAAQLALWLVAAAGVLTGPAMAGKESSPAASSAAAWPPLAYRLEEVGISVQREPAHGLPLQRVSVSGSGEGVRQWQGRQEAFRIDRDGLLDIVNALYRMRFFDLPEWLLPPRSVFIKDDGSIGTQAVRMHDATTTSLCFTLPAYKKCVAYEANPPAELEALVQRVLTDAGRRVLSPPTTPPPSKK